MRKLRYGLAIAGLAGVLGAISWLTLAAGPAQGGGSGPPPVSHDTKEMLKAISADRIQQTIHTLVGFGTRHTLSSQTDPNRGIGAATNWAYDQFQQIAATSGGRMTVAKESFVQPAGPRIPVPTTITNVIATLQGTQPESANRIYIVSAHLDSRVTDVLNSTSDAPGADDDGSGVAAVLELARVMATHQFDATIQFALFAGEEQGLFGSAFHAAQLKAAGANVAGMFSDDIIGSSLGENGIRDRHEVRLFAESPPTSETPSQTAIRQAFGGENDSNSRELARFLEDAAQAAVPKMRVWLIYRRDRILRASDHVSFLQQGYPATRFTEPNEDYRHEHQDVRVENGVQFGDLEQFLDYRYIREVARVNGAALALLADGPAAPRGVTLEATSLSPDTTLHWQANTEPDLAGYEIVYRDTTAPQWEHVIHVGNVTHYKIEGLTEDNFLFGVRAVDTHGNRSVVSFALPG
jgi:hypothetical protein